MLTRFSTAPTTTARMLPASPIGQPVPLQAPLPPSTNLIRLTNIRQRTRTVGWRSSSTWGATKTSAKTSMTDRWRRRTSWVTMMNTVNLCEARRPNQTPWRQEWENWGCTAKRSTWIERWSLVARWSRVWKWIEQNRGMIQTPSHPAVCLSLVPQSSLLWSSSVLWREPLARTTTWSGYDGTTLIKGATVMSFDGRLQNEDKSKQRCLPLNTLLFKSVHSPWIFFISWYFIGILWWMTQRRCIIKWKRIHCFPNYNSNSEK